MFFFFNDTATTEIYTLSLHDALPIYIEQGKTLIVKFLTVGDPHPEGTRLVFFELNGQPREVLVLDRSLADEVKARSEEHTSELQSRLHLVCRLLLEKKRAVSVALTQ